MLLRFSLENYRSFADKEILSAVASKERQHVNRVAKIGRYSLGLCPVTAIYGGNASGKSNLIHGLQFVKKMVTRKLRENLPIPVEAFKLDKTLEDQPTTFCLEFLVNDRVYELFLKLNRHQILEERLTEVLTKTEKILYHRLVDQVDFHQGIRSSELIVVAKGTSQNQLFLNNCASQKISNFQEIYEWFDSELIFLKPDSRYFPLHLFGERRDSFVQRMNELLKGLDTGIEEVSFRKVDILSTQLPNRLVDELKEELPLNEFVGVFLDKTRLVISRTDDGLEAMELVTKHRNSQGELVEFSLHHESDGSCRLIDLLPAFLGLSRSASTSVYVVDELDRSLHSLLLQQLLQKYLQDCSPTSRSQLIFTTHDLTLMDQELLRRDEIYVVERAYNGASHLFSAADYRGLRNDKDLRKFYMQGRLGGVPRFTGV